MGFFFLGFYTLPTAFVSSLHPKPHIADLSKYFNECDEKHHSGA